MFQNLPGECFQELCKYQDVESLFSISKINRYACQHCYYYLRTRYDSLISFFNHNQYPFTIQDCDLDYLYKHSGSSQINILSRLMKQFRCQVLTGNEKMLWLNKLRFEINTTCGLKVFNVLNRYLGMGHDYSLLYLEKTDEFWLDFQGGSNGYDYDDNLKRITEGNLDAVSKMSLPEAFKKLLRYLAP